MLRSSYESVPEQLASVPEQLVFFSEQLRKCSGAVTKVPQNTYKSSGTIISLP